MAAKKKAEKAESEVQVQRIQRERVTLAIKGATPLLLNRQSEKAKRQLLLPPQRKSAGQKATQLKHNPYEEFRDSPETNADPGSPTLIQIPSTCFKNALRSVAVDLPEATSKAALGRLTYVEGEYVPIYGVPQLHMAMVRQSGIARTPDVRTRCIVPRWAAFVSIVYTTPLLNADTIVNLMIAAGLINGLGDWRAQKGNGNYGSWDVVDPNDEEFQEIVAQGGRDVQTEGMAHAACYDANTRELLSWFVEETDRRGFRVNAAEAAR